MLEREETNIEEAVNESLIIFPFSISFILLIYFVRQVMLSSNFYIRRIDRGVRRQNIFFVIAIISKALTVTFIAKYFSEKLFNNDLDSYFFDTVFFAILGLSIILIFFVYLVEYTINTSEKNQNVITKLSLQENELLKFKYMALKSQLNPHFLFNCFNVLTSLITIDIKKAEAFIIKLSNIYRYNIAKGEEMVTSVSTEMDMIKDYIDLHTIRFGDDLVFSSKIEGKFLEYLIPPMTLQILVENAIKHNIMDAEEPLNIEIYNESDTLIVHNNIKLKKNSHFKNESFGVGHNSLKKQFALLGDREIEFLDKKNFYIVKIPLIKNEI